MSDNSDNVIKCLDKGFVRLVDSMGGDNAITCTNIPFIFWA
mgnify:CR=1 FL=1